MDFNTGSSPEGAAGSGSSSGGSGGAPPSMAAAGGEFDYRDPVQSFVRTVTAIVTQPVAFFRGMQRQGDFVNPLIFSLICWEISAIIGGILGILGSVVGLGTRGVGGSLGSFLGSLILTPIIAAIVLVIAAAIIHLLVILIVKPVDTTFETTFRIVAYSDVAALIFWIPILGGIVGGIWYTVLSIFGVREAHSTTMGQAALVVLAPGIVVAIIISIILYNVFVGPPSFAAVIIFLLMLILIAVLGIVVVLRRRQ